MKKQDRLLVLGRVARVQADAALARLQTVAQEENRLRSALADLSREEQGFRAEAADHPARYNGVATAWQRWADALAIETNAHLARVLARKHTVMADAQQDLSRRIAVEALLDRMRGSG